ncbi:MAG: class I SAM-dependent methyltransferase, partial [Bacteroidota bacterium]
MDNYYAVKERVYYAHARTEVLDLLPPQTRSLLDVGCGEGATAAVARARGVRRTVGIELFEEAAAQARPHFDVLLVGDVETLVSELPDEQFDAILCADVLEHLVDPWAVLTALRPHLAPEGHLVASLPNLQYYRILFKIMRDRFEYESSG